MNEPTFKSVDAVLIAEPEDRTTQSGKPYLRLSFANNARRFNKQTNQWEDSGTIYFRTDVYDTARAETYRQQLHKGTHCVVEGQLEVNAYISQKTNQAVPSVNVNWATISILLRKAKQQQNNYQAPPAGDAWTSFGGSGTDQWASNGVPQDEPPF